ncbi:MAG TPA: hypothetical protein VMO26_14705 [Vicinamibacterales bacterium]|nr:hypothetical protein [Vicinamibacterales bacterium]
MRGLEIEGQTAVAGDEGRWAIDYVITPGLMESLRVPLIEGRSITDADGAHGATGRTGQSSDGAALLAESVTAGRDGGR